MGMIRFALAMAVLLSHLPLTNVKFIGGGLAVQAFFVVSGFYMALVLNGKYTDRGLFYTNRLLRIYPAYFVMMAIAAVFLFGFKASGTATLGMFEQAYTNPVTAIILGFEHILLVGQDILFWMKIEPDGDLVFDLANAPPAEDKPWAWQALLVPQSWSLSIELMFYAVAPFLARLNWRWLVALAAASIALRLSGYWLSIDLGLWQARFFPTALFLFIFGMLAHKALPLAMRLPAWTGWAATAAALTLIIFLPLAGLPDGAVRWITYVAIAAAAPFAFHVTRNLTADRWIGELSYPLYLTHLPFIGVVLTYEPPMPVLCAIAGSIALAILLFVLVDRPVDRWRQARAAGKAGPASTMAAATP
ncbi:MAG: acyltransferase [Hyphomonas sp.]|nr:acyltransferase [Hyphomonas sp.]